MTSRGEFMLHKLGLTLKKDIKSCKLLNEQNAFETIATSPTLSENTGALYQDDALSTGQAFFVTEDGFLTPVANKEDQFVTPIANNENQFFTFCETENLENNKNQFLTPLEESNIKSLQFNALDSSLIYTGCGSDNPAVNLEAGLIEDEKETTTSNEDTIRETTTNIINNDANPTKHTEETNDSLQSDEEGSNVTIKRKKRHQVKESEWTYKKAKIAREKGKNYKGRKVNAEGKIKFSVDKAKREMKDIKCKCKGKSFHCSSLSRKDRERFFSEFWRLSWKEKRMYVRGVTEVNVTQRARDRKQEGKSRRSLSYKYFFKRNHEKLRVCKATFLATLGVGDWMVLNWLKDDKVEDRSEDESSVIEGEKLIKEKNDEPRARKRAGIQLEELLVRQKALTQFFELLPKVPSHYCRATSKKLYLEPVWTSKRQIYDVYCEEWCKEKKIKPLSTCSFYKVFDDLNLALYRPKKDQCDTCRSYKLGHIENSAYNDHIKKKEDARKEKEEDKKEEQHVFTMDLQSLLLCPKSNASALYYKCKLSVHNFTLYDLKSNEGFCYIWNETEGGLSANEFSSILEHFISSRTFLHNTNCKIIFYSDGCNYQNRNVLLSNVLLYLAKMHGITIEQKYLEKGHTQMECDSMHATIERRLKNRDINVPADYVAICTKARKNPKPYSVKYLDHKFFKDYSKAVVYKTIRPGKLTGDPKVTDIKSLKYCTDGIFYKLDFKEAYLPLPVRKCHQKLEAIQSDFPNLYKDRLKINDTKFKHLQEIKNTLAADFHSFYDLLPHT